MNTTSNKFNFFVPLSFEKGTDGKGASVVKIKGVASSEAEDSDGETLIPAGFDFGPLLKTGFLNWNHQAGKSAKAICGEPTSAKIINNGKDFYIEGFLYPNAQGKEVADLAETLEMYSPNRRLGFSIEGQATEKDPMNEKRITKARITGVAITQSPKNPNTLMSIIKGETDDLYIEDEELTDEEKKKQEEEKKKKEGTTEKAMDTEAMTPAMPESVEHKEKPTVGLSLNKSEVYIQIYDRYTTDVIKAKEIFNFISNVNEKLFNMTKGEKITEETLQKSFEILDGLVKGKEDTEEGVNKIKEKEEEEDEEKTEPATSGKEVAEEETEEVKKAKACTSMAKSLLSTGMAQGDVVKAMTAVGVDLTMAETSCQACISQAEALKENGGTITTETAPIVKGEESVILESTPDPVLDLVKGLQNGLGEGFKAIGVILKSVVDERNDLKETLNTLQKGFDDLSDDFEKLAETPAAPKSKRTVKSIERFEKGEEEGNEDMYCINNAADVKRLGDRIMGHVEILKSKGQEDLQLEKAIADLEISKSTDYTAIAPKLRALNITLVK